MGTSFAKPVAKSGIAVSAFVLGIAALIAALIPYLGIALALLPGSVGLGLGIAAVVKRRDPKVLALLGLIFSAASVPMALLVSVVVSLSEGAPIARNTDMTVTYSVDGNADRAEVTYQAVVNGELRSKSEEVSLPWTITVTPQMSDTDLAFPRIRLDASAGSIFDNNETTLNCAISIDGTLQNEQTTTAVNPEVNCVIE